MQPRIFAAAVYFFYFAAGGSLVPYLNLYYQTIGMSKQQIGVLIASATLAAVVAAPVWSVLADAFRLHRYLLPLAMFGTLGPVALLAQSTEFTVLWLLVVLYALFNGPIVALADNAVLSLLGEDRAAYGRLRLWGAVGFGVAAWGGGVLVERMGMSTAFGLFIGFMLLCGLAAIRLPAPQISDAEPFLRNLKRLSTNPAWLGFLTAVFLVGISTSFIHNYYVLYITDLGGSESLYGLSVAAAGLSELPVFFFAGRLVKRFTAPGLLVIGFVAFALRTLLISMIPSPDWAVVPQLLHGLSFSALWTAGVVYVAQMTPPGLGATAQSAFGVTLFGIAGAVGGVFGAHLYETAGPVVMYRVAALTAVLGLCCFLIVEFHSRRRTRLAGVHPG
jgi:MFS transporter, PPP family, 3-phenylpropionic acid transporter